ncbi:MAG: hypothetical protein CV087_16030 [Candidatus Brocadia sp. WS118]|nr:MAG: hypothetical protein CV087_16030 [Candidatus Brocadia sp. WS118]
MLRFQNSPSFSALLECCTDQTSPYWEAGWDEFLNRYKEMIYKFVVNRCFNWKVERLGMQLNDVVNDIVSEVYIILLNKLYTYRVEEGEQNFRYWLATVCNRASGSYMKRRSIAAFIAEEIEDVEKDLKKTTERFQTYIRTFEIDTRFELYEHLVLILRTSGEQKRNVERDIHIFYLYVWADLPKQIIANGHPCFADDPNINEGNIDNVIHRFRSFLRKTANL